MSCVPTTSTEYSKTRQTFLTEVWTTSTRSIPILTAITTSDGQVFTPIRVVEVSSAVEVTTVVASLVPARTVVVECTDTAASTSLSSSVVASSSSSTSAASSKSPATSSSTASSSTSAPITAPAASSSESSTTSLTTTITLTVPPSSSTPPATSSSASNDTDPIGALSPQAAEEELSKGTIGGLAAGGIGLFVLILVALWFVQRQFGKGIGEQVSRGGVMGKRTRKGGGGGQGGSEQYRGLRNQGSLDQICEKLPDNDRPPPLLPAVVPHTRWSAITLPPMFRPSAPTPIRASISSAPPTNIDIPPVPIRGGSHIRHTSAPLSLQSSTGALKRPEYDSAISPTPASLDRQERAERAGSVWNRLSALTWHMSWSLPSPIPAAVSLRHPAVESSNGSDSEPKPIVVVDVPTVETRGSARVGRIPSMVDLQEIGRGIRAVSQAETRLSRSRTGSGISTPPHLAPARPSSEYIREEDKPVENPTPGGLPPPPMRSNSLVRNQSKRSMSIKSRDNLEQKKSSRRRSDHASSSPKDLPGRMILGCKRSDASLKVDSRSSRGSSRDGSRTPGSLNHIQGPYAFPASQDLYAPSAYAQPGMHPASTRKDPRRPPSLHLAKEVSMARLWIPDQSIAAFNPDSAHRTPRETTDSAYDGMTEIDFTPLSAVLRATPRTIGREESKKGLPKLPVMETSASSSFKADWEAAVSAR